jgi:hypothetical protein
MLPEANWNLIPSIAFVLAINRPCPVVALVVGPVEDLNPPNQLIPLMKDAADGLKTLTVMLQPVLLSAVLLMPSVSVISLSDSSAAPPALVALPQE